MFYFDRYYLVLVLPAFLFALYAQYKVKNTFNKYRAYSNSKGMTGADTARLILDTNNLNDVRVERVGGTLSDHYDPRSKTVRLSESVYGSTSLAAVGVAAHETGHAIQHDTHYAPLALRSGLVPVANIGSAMGPYMAIFGLMLRLEVLIYVGILLYTVAVGFYLLTLPVEFNASKRAVEILGSTGMYSVPELVPVRKVLTAAAMTYVASAAVAMASLLRLILLANGRRRNN
jgi:Zn-dependent membrane protease YugP